MVESRKRTPQSGTYRSWAAMIQRCTNPSDAQYHRYGGRGITVCSDWRGHGGFARFLEHMGERPEGLTLDRINNDGPYAPGNCRWATRSEQAQNRHRAAYFDRERPMATCHPERPHQARGLCRQCYQTFKAGNLPSSLRGTGTDFEQEIRRALEEFNARKAERKALCHPRRKHHGLDLCATCYALLRNGYVHKDIRGTPLEQGVLREIARRKTRN